MKRFILLIVAITLISVLCTVVAYAQKSKVEISIPDTFLNIQEYGDAFVDINITNLGETDKFTVEYSRDEFETVYNGGTYTIGSNMKKTIRITENLPKGGYVMSVRVKSGEDVSEASQRMAVLEKYKPQFMDDYTRIGIHAKWGEPNLTTSHYNTTIRNTDYAIRLLGITGVKMARYGTGLAWEHLEKEEGKITWFDLPSLYRAIESNTNSMLNIQPTHPVYGLSDNKETIEKAVRYAQNRIADGAPNIKFFTEFGNEPDLDKFWKGRDLYGIQYMNFVRYMSLGINDVTMDLSRIGGVVSGGSDAPPFLKYMFDQDAYKYLDAFSYHPYMKRSTVDLSYDSFTEAYESVADGKGGWLQKAITELGWYSEWERTEIYMSHEEKVPEITKTYLKTYLHDLDLTCWYALSENGLGIQPQGQWVVASPCVAALCNINKMLNSALYVGEFQFVDGVQCAMFVRDGEPMMAAWMPGNEPIEYTFNTDVNIDDMYGNLIKTAQKVKIDSDVYYITGFGKDYIYKTAEMTKNAVYDKLAEEYSRKFDVGIFEEARACKQTDIEKDSLCMLNKHYDVGDKLIDAYINGETTLELPELTQMLFDLHIAGDKLANVYAMDAETGINHVSEKYQAVQNKVDKLKGEEKHSTILYTDKILKYSRRYYVKAKDCASRDYNKMQTGITLSSSLLSERLAIWADRLIPFQEIDDTIGILTITNPMQTTFDVTDKKVEINYSIDNKRIRDIDGEIIVVNGDEKVLGNPIPVKVEPYEYVEKTIKILNDGSVKQSDMYKIRLIEKGKVLNEKWFPVTRKSVITAELAESKTVFSDINTISVKVTNNTGIETSGKVEITSVCEGWSLETTEDNYTIEPFGTKYISFNVIDKKQVPFNLYNFGFRVTHTDGTVLKEQKAPLNFSVIVRSDREYSVNSFDGNMEDWANAYPVYASTPENPDNKSEWQNADTAIVTFYKYDDNNLYMISNVFDNILCGRYVQDQLWLNDSIQIAIDPLNNAGTKLQVDDWMLMLGGSNAIGLEAYYTMGPGIAKYTPIENMHNIIRDNDKNVTRYFIKIPFNAILPLEGVLGTKFRMNSCYNDADVEKRHRVTQVNLGIMEGGDKRNPSLYYEYTMVGYETAASKPDENGLIDLTLNGDPLQY